MNSYIYIYLYLIVINIIAFAFMGIDKRKAILGRYRISEQTLFSIALIGGSVGAMVGMYYFRHKTKHISFVIGMPLIFLTEISVFIYVYMILRTK